MKEGNKIAVLGLWHLGLVTAVGLAEMGWQVVGFDEDKDKVTKLNNGAVTIFEPELENHLQINLSAKRLKFSDNLNDLRGISNLYFTFDTPLDDHDQVDLSIIFNSAKKLKSIIPQNALLLISSQVPIGTCEKIQKLVGKNVQVCYIPENLRLGRSWQRFFHPAMLVIGTSKESTYQEVKKLFSKIKAPKIWTSVKTAEMVKHSINSFLATNISWANELGNIAEKTGADFYQVAKILKLDERISPYAPIMPGLGFAGGTLARDLKILKNLGQRNKYETLFIDSVLSVNENQKKWVVKKLKEIFKNLEGKKIGILGLTYTSQTSTLRRSLSLETIADLVREKAVVKAYDPKADKKELTKSKNIQTLKNPEKLFTGQDAVVVMTGWEEFLSWNWKSLNKLMKYPLILDPNNFLADLNLEKIGFKYVGFGRGKDENI